eukprot:4536584-Pyramimonas_sp.AAC.1
MHPPGNPFAVDWNTHKVKFAYNFVEPQGIPNMYGMIAPPKLWVDTYLNQLLHLRLPGPLCTFRAELLIGLRTKRPLFDQ